MGPPMGSHTSTGPSGRAAGAAGLGAPRSAPSRHRRRATSSRERRRRARPRCRRTHRCRSRPPASHVAGPSLGAGLDADARAGRTRPPASRRRRGQALAAGAGGRHGHHAARPLAPLGDGDPVAQRRRPPGRPPGRRARAHHQHVGGAASGRRRATGAGVARSTLGRPSWPVRGSTTQVTMGLRASRTWHVWLHRMQGRMRSASPAASLAHQVGVGDLGPGHLHASHAPSTSARSAMADVDDRALGHHGRPRPTRGARPGGPGRG